MLRHAVHPFDSVPTSSLPLSRLRPARVTRVLRATASLAFVAGACRGTTATRLPFPAPVLAADSAHHRLVADGLAHHAYQLSRLPSPEAGDTLPGPWRVQVLEADRRRCWQPFPHRAGVHPMRAPLSALARDVVAQAEAGKVVGGINADFFLFAPNGVLVGPHIYEGIVISGPGDRVSFVVDSAGGMHLARLASHGIAVSGHDTLQITGWNRWSAEGLALYDMWHGRIDSLRASVVLELGTLSGPAERGRWRLVRVDSAPPVAIPLARADQQLLVLGRGASPAAREHLLAFGRAHVGMPLDSIGVSLAPLHPMHAVGGHGVLLRRGAIPPAVDSTGAASFARARHPRSAVGWDASGRRLLLVTVDGRQPGYSVGMTLRELARTMRALGATEALNLDGGGSTTLVVARSDRAGKVSTETLNRPSDAGGERAIANALMIARNCAR